MDIINTQISVKKIAFTIPTIQAGGMERVMTEIVNFISLKKDIECHLIIYGKASKNFYKINKEVLIYRPSFKFNDKQRTLSTLKTVKFIRKTIKHINPISILSFGELWNNLILLSLLGTKYPIFISDRSNPIKNLGFFHEKLRKILYPRSAGFIAQTSKAAEINTKRFPKLDIRIIANPIREIINLKDIQRENIVVSVGRLIDTKHFDRLIDIFSKINNKDWKLVIIGDDSGKQKNHSILKKQIENLRMTDSIILTGKQNNVDDYLLRASIFAFTSSSEGFPNVIGEAMSAGLPVIAYDCMAGPSDMIKDKENGFLIPLFNDGVYESKLAFLMQNKNTRVLMGKHARVSMKAFSIEKIISQYFNFITKHND